MGYQPCTVTMQNKHWILEGEKLKEVNLMTWVTWLQNSPNRRLAEDIVMTLSGPVWVSTVFLSIDHNFRNDGPPLVFETLVFPVRENDGSVDYGDTLDDFSRRYSTYKQAMQGHNHITEKLKTWKKN